MKQLGLVLVGVGLWNVVWGVLHIAGVPRPGWLGTRSADEQLVHTLVGVATMVLGFILYRRASR
jgi:hypothetical protein